MTETLFTIGYSGRSIDEVILLLTQHQVTAVCDVRSMPYSSRNTQFNRESLKQVLKLNNIDYVFLGAELGARPKDPSCYVDGKAVYRKISSSAPFQAGIDRIVSGIKKGYVLALMCAEKDPMTCHRSILICRNLRDRQISIRHIIDPDTTETQIDLEKRLITQLKISLDLFSDLHTDTLVERAYEIQGDRIAYVEKGELEKNEKLADVVREEHGPY